MQRQFDDLQLGSLELFCSAAEAGSFSAAAQALGLTPAAVSRAIARLEARLGARLFVRTTRRVRLSDAGRVYYEQCRQALAQLAEAEREVGGHQREPSGTVRISMPTSYGNVRVLPLLPAFRERYPRVDIDAHVSNRSIDFTAEGFDLAIRIQPPDDSSLVVRTLERTPMVVVATPGYLRRRGVPRSIAELEQHDCIQFIRPATGRPLPWHLHERGVEREWSASGGIRISDDIMGCITLLRAGAGLMQTLRFLVEDDLRRGTLVEVLHDHAGTVRPVSLLYPSRRALPLRVRVLIDFLVECSGRWREAPVSS